MTSRKGLIYGYVVILIIAVSGTILVYNFEHHETQSHLKTFESCTQISEFIASASPSDIGYGVFATGAVRTTSLEEQVTVSASTGTAKSDAPASEDYSTTNIQVGGVDEADIVKNDGKYIYTLSGDDIFIIDAYPPENAQVLSKIEFAEHVHEMFVSKDKLIVFLNEYGPLFIEPLSEEAVAIDVATTKSILPAPKPKTLIYVYDISDRTNPRLERNLSVEGNYYDSRMIGNYVYAVIDNPIQRDNVTIPIITEQGISKPACRCAEVLYFDIPDYSYKFTTIMAINTQTSEEPNAKVFLMGYTQNIYVSMNNIFVTYMKRISEVDVAEKMISAMLPELPPDIAVQVKAIMNSDKKDYQKMNELSGLFNKYINNLSGKERERMKKILQGKTTEVQKQIAKEMERAIIHKIAIDNGNIDYVGQGDVPGNILNQFSMDEYKGYFRIATTTGRFGGTEPLNHLYILDSDLNIVGKVEDLAKGERIYSARFMGERAYMVTFRQIDPLFVIDLSSPTAPQVLGYLKVTGYSDYLHPYDKNHIIGIGKETIAQGRRTWQQGVKISLFDVSDVANPKEISKFEIGDRGTHSEALNDHKAFLFSYDRNLLVLPITLAEIDESQYVGEVPNWASGKQVWQGAYIFDISLENGIRFRDRITHMENNTKNEYGYYDLPYGYQVRRSLYMDNTLYTVSNKVIKANDLNTIQELKKINLE